MRASGSDENAHQPPREMSLEAALEFIEDDEMVDSNPFAKSLILASPTDVGWGVNPSTCKRFEGTVTSMKLTGHAIVLSCG